VATSLPSTASPGAGRSSGSGRSALLTPRGVRVGAASSGVGRGEAPWLAPSRRTRLPYLALGVVLILAGAAVFFVGSLRASGRVPVLVLARDVNAGQIITRADLRAAQVAAGADVQTVPAGDAPQMVGRTMAVPRRAGAVLSPDDVGASRFPPGGQAVAAVGLKAGAFPPGLTSGARVAVLVTPSRAAAGAGAVTGSESKGPRSTWLTGQVVGLSPDPSGGGTTVLSVLMDENDASMVSAAAEGTVSVMELSASSSTGQTNEAGEG
jgi:hypothetical protein